MRQTVAMATPLDNDQRTALASDHPAWTITGEEVSRTFEFADFNEAMGFVNRVALAAEKADHHPDIDIRWNKVALTLTTHSADSLTDNDAELVATIDSWQAGDG